VYRHRTIPNGCVELYAEIGTDPRAGVAGPQTTATVQPLLPGTTVVGVRFHPGAAAAVLRVDATDLVDLRVGLGELWGRSGAELAERLADAPSAQTAAALLQAEIEARRAPERAADPLVAAAVGRLNPAAHPPAGSDLWELAARLGVSTRHLRRRLLAGTGHGPKALHRILRFQRFLALAHTSERFGGLARLAAEAGYADQPHLTRESTQLAGLTPRALLHESDQHCRGRHDHAASFAPLLAGSGASLSFSTGAPRPA
jgi:AraC-like DNA-binding protein